MIEPVLFARIGWMEYYQRKRDDDARPMGGGAYNDDPTNLGNEAYNFKPIKGKVCGFFRLPRHDARINLKRIVPGASGHYLADVLVVFVAKHQGKRSQEVVGWYRNATVYRDRVRDQTNERRNFDYCVETASKHAVLVPSALRQCSVPVGKGAIGQANVCYVFEKNGTPKQITWPDRVIAYITSYKGENLVPRFDVQS